MFIHSDGIETEIIRVLAANQYATVVKKEAAL